MWMSNFNIPYPIHVNNLFFRSLDVNSYCLLINLELYGFISKFLLFKRIWKYLVNVSDSVKVNELQTFSFNGPFKKL